jgi:hypothetical protein
MSSLRRLASRLVAVLLVALLTHQLLSTAVAQKPAPKGVKKPVRKVQKPKAPKVNLPNQGAPPKLGFQVAPVDAGAIGEVVKSARRIDELVEARLAAESLTSNPASTDDQFVRRIYLDVSGTIPTGRDAYYFVSSTRDDKRSVLIDHLLNQPGYASHSFNYWADILRLVDKPSNVTHLRPYADWLKNQLRSNAPYDKMVHRMLSAEGKPWENPAVGYKLRDRGMPLDNLNNTIRVFLGTRIGCAQCHDHPFDRWTQKEFYQLAAYEAGVRTVVSRTQFKLDQSAEAQKQVTGTALNRLRQLERINREQVFEQINARLRFPKDYAYTDAKAGDLVEPKVLFGAQPAVQKGTSRRTAFADWLTAADNPRFAKAIANRLWKRALGVGLIEPVDDIQDDSTASNPELMDFLTAEMVRLKFNLKEFQRIIYHTRTYQRQVTYEGRDTTRAYHFPGPVLRRMTAEQVWDSLLTLTLPAPDHYLRPSDKPYQNALSARPGMTAVQLVEKANQIVKAEQDRRAADRKQAYKGVTLRRASELPQPLPDGHFLRQFGQSDRNIIAAGSTEGTVPQLLTLFNGPVTHMMLESGSVVNQEVLAAATSNRIDVIFLSILGRRPTSDERQIASREIRDTFQKYKDDPNKRLAGYGNVIWALLNTREFLFIQ